jgi:hypothetical protein
LAGPAASASSPTGMGSVSSVSRGGIPMGSTELGAGGLSPPPAIVIPSAPSSTTGSPSSTMGVPCATSGATTSTAGGVSTSSGSC